MHNVTKISCALLLMMTTNTSIASMQSTGSIETSNEEIGFNSLITLFFEAARIGNNDVIKEFVSAGFPINERNPQSYTALMVAAYQGQKETVHLLLQEGANPCLEDKRGNTAFLGALLKREVTIARELYQADCRYDELRNKSGLNLNEFAALFGQEKIVKSFNEMTE